MTKYNVDLRDSNAKTTAGLASHTESDTPTVAQARSFVKKQVQSRTDPDDGLTAPELHDRMQAHYGKAVEATTIRDIIQQLRHDDKIPIANFGSGYFRIASEEHFRQYMNQKLESIENARENMQVQASAWYSESDSHE